MESKKKNEISVSQESKLGNRICVYNKPVKYVGIKAADIRRDALYGECDCPLSRHIIF